MLLPRNKYVNSGRLHEVMLEIFVNRVCPKLSDVRWVKPAKGLPARDAISFRFKIRLVTAERPVNAPIPMDVMPVLDKSSVALPVYPAQLVSVDPVQLQPAGRSWHTTGEPDAHSCCPWKGTAGQEGVQFHGLGKVMKADSKRESAPAPMQRSGLPLKSLHPSTFQRQAAERRPAERHPAAAVRATHNM